MDGLGPIREAVALSAEERNYWSGIVMSSVYPANAHTIAQELAKVECPCPTTYIDVIMHRIPKMWRE